MTARKPASRRTDSRVSPSRGRAPCPAPASQVGANIRHFRILKGLKARDLAERVGCSESMISKIENGKAQPSLTTLHRIVHSMNITVTALFDTRPADRGVVTRDADRPSYRIDRAGSTLERLVPANEGHLLEGNLHVLAPGGGSEGMLSHEGEEAGFVVEGELELTVDGTKYRLSAGDSFVFRSELPHSYRNPCRRVTRVVWVSTPPTF